MYLKSIFLLTEAFYDKTLTPQERMYRAWFCKTFLVTWDRKKKSVDTFITTETFSDTICCCDGLFLYMMLLHKNFPDQLLVPHFHTSDVCEMAFAFIRIGRFFGRRTNVDSVGVCQGLEAKNRSVELATKMEDLNASCAHTRGRSILRPALPLQSEQKLTGGTKPSKLFRGSEIDQQAIRKAMKDGTKDCLNECKKFNLDVFIDEDPDDPVVQSKSDPRQVTFGETVQVQYFEPEAEDFSDDEDLSHDNFVNLESEEEADFLETSMGSMSRKRAERVFLNGGGLKIGAKSRSSRFKNKLSRFDANSFKEYTAKKICCRDALLKGKHVRLARFKKPNLAVEGVVAFMSKKSVPFSVCCSTHDNGNANVWLWVAAEKIYVRCIL